MYFLLKKFRSFFHWQILLPFFSFLSHAYLFRSWLIDDAGISFAYARNLFHGHGIVSQYGVPPVEGFSNPLWIFLIAPAFFNDPFDPTPIIKIISLVLILATFVMVSKIIQYLLKESWWSRVTTVAVLATLSLNTSFVVWTTSGLENSLNVFCCALYCLFILKYVNQPKERASKFAIYAGLCAAALALTRPDGIIFSAAFPLVSMILLLNDKLRWKIETKNVSLFSITTIGLFAAYISFRLAYFEDIYPNTYYAKGGPSLPAAFSLMELKKTCTMFSSMFFSWLPLTMLALCILTSSYVIKNRKSSLIIFLFPIIFCSLAIYHLLPNDWMGEFRFATNFFLMFNIFLYVSFAYIFMESSYSPKKRKKIFLIIVTILFLQSILIYLPRSKNFSNSPTVPFSYVADFFGKRFNDYASKLDINNASLLCPDLGGTLYFSRHTIFDLAGLTDRNLAKLINKKNSDSLKNYVFNELRPTFIHLHGFWSLKVDFHQDKRFKKLYTAIWEKDSTWGNWKAIDGDYVLKKAVTNDSKLKSLQANIQELDKIDKKDTVPFPRG